MIEEKASSWIFEWIRVSKEDSVLIYWILEAQEGCCSYSTVDGFEGKKEREIEIRYPFCFLKKMNKVLNGIREDYGLSKK